MRPRTDHLQELDGVDLPTQWKSGFRLAIRHSSAANRRMRRTRRDALMQSTIARYAFGVATVAVAFVLKLVLTHLTGRGAPFILFFAAMLVTSLFAGAGPTILALAITLPLAAAMFMSRVGHPVSQAILQALLYAGNGLLIVYLAVLTDRRRRRMQETIELAPDAYLLADMDARVTDVNEAACRLLGYGREELVGRSIFDIVPREDIPRLKAVKTELMTPHKVHKAEWDLRRKDGTLLPVEVSSNILPGGRWQAFLRDISESRRITAERERLLEQEQLARQQAESANAQLRESEERFRLTIDEAPIGMALVALDGAYVRVNQVLSEITGYSADELMKLCVQDITHPDDLAEDLELGRRLARGDIPRYQREKRYIRKDGSIVDVTISGSVLRGPDGAARYYIAQMEDITQRKRAVEALRLSEAKFSGIVSIAADAIISVDKDQRIVLFNDGAQKIFGYPKDEVIGTTLERLIPERFRAIHGGHFARFTAGEEAARTMGAQKEIFGLRKNGEEFPAEASISKVTVGGATFLSVVLHDVTYRKSVEAALQCAVSERDDVLRIVAHDLRNPLSTIIAQASLLERPEPELERRDERPRLVIMRAAKRMNDLIQDLLDVAVVEAGKLKVARDRLSAADLARDVVETQAPLAASSGLELRLEVSGDIREVWGDRNRLLRVFDNLIGNALKFTKEGGRITLGVVANDQEVVFSVADTGAGIDAESLPHVFERFWQAAGRSKRLGAGLGLPITRGIVEAHGGRIWVESTVGSGTTFFFTIPSAPAETSGGTPAEGKRAGPFAPRSADGWKRRQPS
jgi:PAS domain S-box-containing protein